MSGRSLIDVGDDGAVARFGLAAFGALCLLFGGASAGGYVANALLQIVAVVILALVVLRGRGALQVPGSRSLLLLAVLSAALVAVQLIPLPPAVWTRFAGRGAIAEGMRLIGLEPAWAPLSLRPVGTVASAVWTLPALAMAALAFATSREGVRMWARVLVLVAAGSALFGLAQVAGPQGGPLYPYAVTNAADAVGLFANANHHATLMLCALPFLAALAARGGGRGDRPRSTGLRVAMLALALLLLFALVLIRSAAGLLLAVPVVLASAALFRGRLPRRRTALLIGAGAGAMVIAVLLLLMLSPLGTRYFGWEAGPQSRQAIWPATWRAALGFLPWGSGLGTFVGVFARGEDPTLVTSTYVNHAHNDYLELLLETGIAGVLLVAAGLFWWARRAWRIWTGERAPMAQAATVASGAILLHSLADYPLRTAAIMATFAVCCAIMANPAGSVRRATRETGARHLSA